MFETSEVELLNSEGKSPNVNHETRLRCPCCGFSWCRCRFCGARYTIGGATACATPHRSESTALYCRCGARVGKREVETPAGQRLALLPEPANARAGLIGRLRVQSGARTRFRRLMGASSRRSESARAAVAVE
ncbi:MAG: hypothetical protein HY271_20095 [Deltaproteobacteria bacterium]|nr:hypothetical protein [Deltaproteobacteria bacterium]